jgi:hypothetical protein
MWLGLWQVMRQTIVAPMLGKMIQTWLAFTCAAPCARGAAIVALTTATGDRVMAKSAASVGSRPEQAFVKNSMIR